MDATLDHLALGRTARITHIAWDRLRPDEGRRLRELGIVEDVEVQAMHRGSLFSRDPLVVGVGRMRIVIRARQAAAILLASAASTLTPSFQPAE